MSPVPGINTPLMGGFSVDVDDSSPSKLPTEVIPVRRRQLVVAEAVHLGI